MFTSVIITTSGIFLALSEASILTVVGRIGETVTLPCKYDVKTHGTSNVCWGRGQTWFSCEYTLVSTDELSVNFRQSQRYSLPSLLHTGDASLTIKMAQKADSGFYVCRIEIPGLFNDLSYTVFLIVTNEIAPVNVNTVTGFPVSAKVNEGIQDAELPNVDSVAQVVNPEDKLETFILTTVRAGAVVFIPGLIIALVWKLQCSRERTDSSGKENGSTQQQNNTNSQPQTPLETPHVEDD